MEKTVISINGVETTISKNEPLDLKLIPSKKKKKLTQNGPYAQGSVTWQKEHGLLNPRCYLMTRQTLGNVLNLGFQFPGL